MQTVISEEELAEFKKIKGEIKGIAIKENIEFILVQEGQTGVEKLEKVLSGLGHPMKYKDIQAMIFYPLWLDAVTLVAIQRIFNYDDKKFQEMGKFEPKVSLLIRLFLKYLFSLERAAKEVPNMWRKTFTVGDLKVVDFDEEKKCGNLRLENYVFIPIQCQVLRGYFSSVLQMIVKGKITCQETECVHKGGKYHNFFLKWS